MSERSDLFTTYTDEGTIGKKRKLAYSCNCGWLDLGHMNPESPSDPERGAANLWRQICDGDRPGNEATCTNRKVVTKRQKPET